MQKDEKSFISGSQFSTASLFSSMTQQMQNTSQSSQDDTVDCVASGNEQYVTTEYIDEIVQSKNREYRWKHSFSSPLVLRNLSRPTRYLYMDGNDRNRLIPWIKADCAETALRLQNYVKESKKIREEETKGKKKPRIASRRSRKETTRDMMPFENSVLCDEEAVQNEPQENRQLTDLDGMLIYREENEEQLGIHNEQFLVQPVLLAAEPLTTLCNVTVTSSGSSTYTPLTPVSSQKMNADVSETVHFTKHDVQIKDWEMQLEFSQ